MAASIGSTNETFNQSYSNDFDSSEAPAFLGYFKLPVPPVVRRPQTITRTAVHHMHSCTSPAGRLESHQRGFWIETLFQMQRTKALNWLFPENVRRVEKQADSYFLGYMLRKCQGENLRSDSTLPIRSLPHDLSRVEFLTLASGTKASIFWHSAFFMVQLSHLYTHDYWKNRSFDIWTFAGKWYLLFKTLSRFVIAFLLRSKHLLILWLQSLCALILEPKRMKSDTVFTFSPFICHEVIVLGAMILVFWMLSFKPAFSLSFFTFIKRLFSSSLLSAIRVVSSAYLRFLIFLLAILIPLVIQPARHFTWCILHIS